MHSTMGLRRWDGLMTIEFPELGCTTGGCRCFPLGSVVDERECGCAMRHRDHDYVEKPLCHCWLPLYISCTAAALSWSLMCEDTESSGFSLQYEMLLLFETVGHVTGTHDMRTGAKAPSSKVHSR